MLRWMDYFVELLRALPWQEYSWSPGCSLASRSNSW